MNNYILESTGDWRRRPTPAAMGAAAPGERRRASKFPIALPDERDHTPRPSLWRSTSNWKELMTMSSLVGPLVTPNRYESRFDRQALYIPTFKHPVVIALLAVVLAGACIA